MRKKYHTMPKKVASYILATAMAVGSISYTQPMTADAAQESSSQAVFFTPAPAGHPYEGMPLFDGNPDHYEQYLDAIINYIGLEGTARFAFDTRGDYVLTTGENKGKTIPGSLTFTDCVQGVSTDFPAIVGLGQSWNKELVESVGDVLGNERVNKVDYSDLSNINVMACTATSDLRINPLSGRFDEGFAEDPYLAATMVNEMATGVSGIEEDDNTSGFWQKAVVTTKHFTTYNAQTLRSSASNNASARTLLEYQSQSALKGFESGAVGGFMSSYGRTNGIPNIISPLINMAKSLSPYGLFSVTDAGSVSNQRTYGNGFDTSYVPVIDDSQYNGQGYSAIGAIMAVANSSGASTTRSGDQSFWTLVEQVKAGTYGVTQADVENVARDQIGQLVRCGVLNEDMEDYPFYDQSKGVGETDDYNNTDNQEVALQAAQESIVLLKNDDKVLPLSKDASVYVSGPMSITRFKTTYAVSQSPQITNALYSSAAGIQAIGGEEHVQYSADGQVVNIKTGDGQYLALAEDGKSIETTAEKERAAEFEKYSWGQEGYTYKCLDNGKWLKGTNSGTIEATGEESLEQIANELEATYVTTTMPYRFRVEENEDHTLTYILNSYSESFMGTTPIQGYYTNGRYMCVNGQEVAATETLKDKELAQELRTDNTRFTEEEVSAYGSDTIASGSDYAVVVVGAPTRHSSGEGCDRSDLHLGDGQYEQVANVAKAYPGRTIVVVQTNYPEIIQEFKDNDNVAAILVQPYAGQYGGYALGQVIYGDVSPTGKLSSTWYNTNDVLPEINDYSIPEGVDLSLEDLDPRFTTDMSNADPAQTGLTYMYTDDENVTYEFGAGLTYSEFAYSNLQAPQSISSDQESFEIRVDVKNVGDVDTSEVVQAYLSNPDSAYGEYAPSTKLVSFEKVFIPAGETKTVTLRVDTDDFALWDTNSHEYVVEAGQYHVMVGNSSKNILQTAVLNVTGEAIQTLDASSEPVNVFDCSYASSEVIYREVSKEHTAEALAEASRDTAENAAHNVASGYYAVMSKKDGAWAAMKSVDLDDVTSIQAQVASRNEYSTIEVRADSVDGALLGTIDFSITPVKSYIAPETGEDPDAAIDLPVQELAYETVNVDLDTPLQGVHDVYVVFRNADARIDTIQFVKEKKAAADSSLLATLTAQAAKIDASAYTADSFAKVTQAIEAANKVLANGAATQEEVNAAVNTLVNALTGLRAEAATPKAADLGALNQAIQSAQAVNRKKYTKNSLNKLDRAWKVAESMSKAAPQESLQPVVNDLAEALREAVNSLELKKGQTASVGKLKYKVTSAEKKTVSVIGSVKKTYTSLVIPAKVQINGATYQVTRIADKAFQNQKKLKKITVKAKAIAKVGKNAFKGIHKKAVIKVPASKLNSYKKLFAGKGQAKTVKIKK